METDIDGHTYRIGKLDAYKQLHVTRKLAPALWAFGSAATGAADATGKVAEEIALTAMRPVAEAISKLTDEDTEYVVNTCLRVVQRKEGENAWQPVKVGNGNKLMFEDIGLDTMLKIVFAVIQENLGNFFPGPLAQT